MSEIRYDEGFQNGNGQENAEMSDQKLTRFRVRGQDEPAVEFELVAEEGGRHVCLDAHIGDCSWCVAVFTPGEPVELADHLPSRLDIPLDDKGRIQIAGQEKTAKERHAPEMFEVLLRVPIEHLPVNARALLAKIREEAMSGDLTEKQRTMYDHEPWAKVARMAGLEPYHTESMARVVAGVAADTIGALEARVEMEEFATKEIAKLHSRAASERDAVLAENARLRESLREMIVAADGAPMTGVDFSKMVDRARAALGEGQ